MNHEPLWMTTLEMQFAALKLGQACMYSADSRLAKYKKAFAMADGPLRQAEAFAWSNETTNAVTLAAKTIPSESRIEPGILPASSCWWWLNDTPYVAQWGDELVPVRAILLMDGVNASDGSASVGFLTFGVSKGVPGPFPSSYWTWKYGESYSDLMQRMETLRDGIDQTCVHARYLSRFVLAGCGWLRQRILTTSMGHVERHRRKQLAREHNVPMPSEVKVIQLRRIESQVRPDSAGEPVDWSCRWVVNGHWRNQPYKDERKLIYIMPFVKGPEDKPLRVPSHTVYAVQR